MEAVFRALSDAHRREILQRLLDGERSASDLLAHFTFSQPALSRHLRVLREAGLVVSRAVGRERRYALRREGMRALVQWLHPFERFWTGRLDALGTLLDELGDE